MTETRCFTKAGGARYLVLVLAPFVHAIAACGGDGGCWPGDYGPGPSSGIQTAVLSEQEYGTTPDMVCTGPADEVALLGSLCTRTTADDVMVKKAGDMGFGLHGGPAAEAPFTILVFGYFDDPTVFNHAADIRYAAYMVRSPDAYVFSDAWQESAFSQWGDDEALTGTIDSVVAYDTACTKGGFRGRGSLLWRHTRIDFRFDAGFPC